jgi:hypothetical protein
MYKPCDGHIQKSHVGDNMTTGPGRAEIPLGVICVSISGVRYKTKGMTNKVISFFHLYMTTVTVG